MGLYRWRYCRRDLPVIWDRWLVNLV
jgi:hypothetical protein